MLGDQLISPLLHIAPHHDSADHRPRRILQRVKGVDAPVHPALAENRFARLGVHIPRLDGHSVMGKSSLGVDKMPRQNLLHRRTSNDSPTANNGSEESYTGIQRSG